MTAKIIDGTAIAAKIREEVKEKVAARVAAGKPKPGLATVLVGERVDSATYVRMKQKACADLGMNSFHRPLPIDATQEEVEALVKELNADPAVNGILVQLPLTVTLTKKKFCRRSILKKMWMVSTRSISVVWRKKGVSRSLYLALLMARFIF